MILFCLDILVDSMAVSKVPAPVFTEQLKESKSLFKRYFNMYYRLGYYNNDYVLNYIDYIDNTHL